MRQLRERAQVRAPAVGEVGLCPVAQRRFAHMVQHQPVPVKVGAKSLCVRQLVAKHQHVIAQAFALQQRHAAPKSCVVQEAGYIGLILDNVAKTAQRGVLCPAFQPFFKLCSAQIGPAHCAQYAGVFSGQREQEISLLLQAARLHCDAGGDARRVHGSLAVGGRVVALQHRHAVADPAEVLRLKAPVMLVRVDFHWGSNWYCASEAAFISMEKPGACGGI
jgi:hypothetical protein